VNNRTFAMRKLQVNSHWLKNQQYVGKDYRGIDSKSFGGRYGHFGGE
jgi:hypothetical protein